MRQSVRGAEAGAATGAAPFLATVLGADLAEAEAFIIPETEEEEEDILRGLCSQSRGCRESILFS